MYFLYVLDYITSGDLVYCCMKEHVISIYDYSLIFLLLLVTVFISLPLNPYEEGHVSCISSCSNFVQFAYGGGNLSLQETFVI